MTRDDPQRGAEGSKSASGADAERLREEEELERRGINLLGKLARRIQNPREIGGDAKELVGILLESSDRVKTEAVRMVAREVRNYLEELRLTEDLHRLVTTHSLEMKISMSLKPLADATAPATPKEKPPEESGE